MTERAVRTLLSGVTPASTAVSAPSAETAPGSARPSESLDVCLLSYRSDPHSGGQGVYVKHLTEALVGLGHSVDVISGPPYPELHPDVDLIRLPGSDLVEPDASLSSFDPRLLRDPVELFEWASRATGGFPEPFAFGERVRRYFERHDPDYDVVHDNQSLSYGLLALQARGTPTVATVHHPIGVDRDLALEHTADREARLRLRRWYRFLSMQRTVASRLPHVITVSRAAAASTRERFGVSPAALNVVPNGIDTEQFRPIEDIERDPTRIMTTASADTSIKGLEYLLQAVARLVDEGRDVELVLVGGLEPGTPAADLVWWLDIQDAVTIHTDIETERMVELYASSALAVVPSLYEGFGLPAGEAMACGVPLVATTGGGLSEVVGDAGLTVPPGDADALADAIGTLLDDPDRRERMGRAGYERVRERFDWEEAARRTVDVYRQAISEA